MKIKIETEHDTSGAYEWTARAQFSVDYVPEIVAYGDTKRAALVSLQNELTSLAKYYTHAATKTDTLITAQEAA
jgi:hypothetical protein